MKKIYLLVAILVACSFVVKSQITVGQSDMPQPGDTIRLSTTTDTIGLPPFAQTGANYTWNYTKLVPQSQTIDTFLSVSSTPLVYQFYFNNVFFYPTYVATVAQSAPNPPSINPVTITNVINYYKASSAAYEGVGFGASINILPTSVKDDTIDYIYRFPMNYGNADSSNSSWHLNIPGIGYYGTKQHRVNHVDGWGTLQTPFGTFSTLRVVTELFITDTLYVDTFHFGFSVPQPEQLQYKWIANGKALPVMQVNETVLLGFPVFNNIVYRDSARKIATGIAQVNGFDNELRVFPNPAKNSVNILGQLDIKNAQIELFNSLGQRLMSQYIGQLHNGTAYQVDLSSYSPGIYYLKVYSGSKASTYKIIKQ